MQEFEKQFINWTIAAMKKNRAPVCVMISNLNRKNPELGEYAKRIEGKIDGSMTNKYELLFQESLVNACLTAPDPQKAAKDFFNAIGKAEIELKNKTIQMIKERYKNGEYT